MHALSAELDPQCALPYAGLANAYTFLGSMGQERPDEAFPRAEAFAQRALELEPDRGEPYVALGAVRLFYR